jgi:putative ABC transport system permease protein
MLRYSLRSLRNSPAFTLLAVLTLAIGIGANVTIFSVINAVLVRSLPIPQPDQVMRVWSTWEPNWPLSNVSAPDFLDWRERNTVFSELGAYRDRGIALQTKGGAERIEAATVSANYFHLLGVNPKSGRGFETGEDQPGRDQVAIFSERLARRLFGQSEGVVGRTIELNGVTHTIVGVMQDDFRLPTERVELWIPYTFTKSQLESRGSRLAYVVGRLKPGVTAGQAQAPMSAIAEDLALKYPDDNTGFGIHLIPFQEDMVEAQRTGLYLLQAAVGCMLLVAALNLANLLLTRIVGRRRELAIRVSLGATRWSLARQLLTESILLSALGGIGGVLLSLFGTDLFVSIAGGTLPRASEIRIDVNVLIFTVTLSTVVGVVCGLLPLITIARRRNVDLQAALTESSRGTVGGVRQGYLRNILVIAEIACALVVLSGAGLLFRSFLKLQESRTGIDTPEKIVTGSIALPPNRYSSDLSVSTFYRAVQEKVAHLPGVKSAGAIGLLPLTQSDNDTSFQIEGQPAFEQGKQPVAQLRAISGEYFQTAGIPLLAGRFLDARDAVGAQRVILINRSLAFHYWKSAEGAIGHRLNLDVNLAVTNVGVVGDVSSQHRGEPTRDEFYFPVDQSPTSGPGESWAQNMVLVVRANDSIDPLTLVAPIKRATAEVDPEIPLSRVSLWSSLIADSVSDRRANLWMIGSFAAVALLLAAMGLYGLISYGVLQRTREIGVRMALGAQRFDVLRMILTDGTRLVLVGIAIGAAVSIGLTRLIQSLLYGIGATDPVTFAGVILLLILVSLVANYLPTRRAMKINPVIALRQE